MNIGSTFMTFYIWVKESNLLTSISDTIISGVTYEFLKKLGTSFVLKIHPFFGSEDETEKYFEKICTTSSINTKEPYQDMVNLFESLTTNRMDEKTKQQFIEELKKWFISNSHEIDKIIKPLSEFDVMVDNFVNVYKNHGIPRNKIIKVIPSEFGFKMKDFENNESIKNIISPKLLEWTSSFFNVQVDWLDGTSTTIYPYKSYPSTHELFSLILELKFIEKNDIRAYFFRSEELNCNSEKTQNVALFLQCKVTTIDKNHSIYRYIPIKKDWDWGWKKSRYELKHIIYFFELLKIINIGYEINSNIIGSIGYGSVFPEQIIKNQKREHWYPEDYVDFPTENVCAKEIHETQECRLDFYERGYKKYINNEIDRIILDEGHRRYIKETALYRFKEE